MRVAVRNINIKECPPDIEPYLRQVNVTRGKEYEVYAVAVIQNIIYVSIIEDDGLEMRRPIWLFEMIDKSMPNDWICNLISEHSALILGPEFLAKDSEAYDQLVDRDPEVCIPFWRRVRAHRQEVIRQILLTEWDPIGIKDEPEGQDLYDSYIPELLVLLEQQPSEQEVFDYLWRVLNDKLELVGDREKAERASKKILTAI